MKTTLYLFISPLSWIIKSASKLVFLICVFAFFILIFQKDSTNELVFTAFFLAVLCNAINFGIDKFMKCLGSDN
jgi:hypothetical protein